MKPSFSALDRVVTAIVDTGPIFTPADLLKDLKGLGIGEITPILDSLAGVGLLQKENTEGGVGVVYLRQKSGKKEDYFLESATHFLSALEQSGGNIER